MARRELTCAITLSGSCPTRTLWRSASRLLLAAEWPAVAAAVARTARPMEPPTCWPTFSVADAIPASVSRTPVTAVMVMGTKMNPTPRAARTRPGKMESQ